MRSASRYTYKSAEHPITSSFTVVYKCPTYHVKINTLISKICHSLLGMLWSYNEHAKLRILKYVKMHEYLRILKMPTNITDNFFL